VAPLQTAVTDVPAGYVDYFPSGLTDEVAAALNKMSVGGVNALKEKLEERPTTLMPRRDQRIAGHA
jgi:hypothetical protein